VLFNEAEHSILELCKVVR